MPLPPLRPFQAEALSRIAECCHLVCISATGSGKTRIVHELLLDGRAARALIISPLVALGRQHRARLEALGIPALYGREEGEPCPETTRAWILSPESVTKARAALDRFRPDLLVVDECHCIDEWGQEFRPSFSEIPCLAHLPYIRQSLWLTATLPPHSERRLLASLPSGATRLGRFSLPPRLALRQRQSPLAERDRALLESLALTEGAGIVFAPTREATVRITRLISAHGLQAVAYHAGLSREERAAIEARLTRNEIRCLVATSAFGMGMDYAQFRWVALWQPPLTPLALAQALGRVGRNGDPAWGILHWHPEDFRWLRMLGKESRNLDSIRDVLMSSTDLRSGLEAYFLK